MTTFTCPPSGGGTSKICVTQSPDFNASGGGTSKICVTES